MDGRIFVELINKLNGALKTSNVEEAINVIEEISNHITPSSFLNHSTLMDEVLANIFTRSVDPKPAISLACQEFLGRWLSFYSAFAPIEFFRMVKKHSKTLPRFMFKVLPPFVSAYGQYFDLHSPDLITSFQTIIEATEPQYLCSMKKQIWTLYRDNSTIENISSLISKLLRTPDSSFAVSVLVRKCPEQLVEQVFQTATFDYILSFLQNLPLYVKFETLTVSVRVADAIFCKMGDIETAYQIIPFIVKRKLSADEEACLKPLWPQLMSDSNKASALAALYSASKFGMIPISDVISLLHFSDKSDRDVRVESIRIGFELLHEVPFRDNFIKILKELSQTRQTMQFKCLLDNLTIYFPEMLKINSKAAYEIVNNALSPTPIGENIPASVLRFLNTTENILDPNFTFDVANIIRHYTHLEDYTDLIAPLKELIYKLSLNIDSLNIDYFKPQSYLKLSLVDSIDPHILTEAIDYGLVQFNVLPYVVDKLRLPYCFDGALGSLLLILKQIGFKNNLDYETKECWVSAEDVDRCVESLQDSFTSSEIGQVILSLLRCIVDLYDSVEISSRLKTILHEIARCLLFALPDESISLLIKLRESNINFQYASSKFYANYVRTYGEIEKAVAKDRDKIIDACMEDYDIAQTYAPVLNQPLPPLPTYHAFEGLDQHKQWLELSREHFLPEQVVLPVKKIELPVKKFLLKRVEIQEGIPGIMSGKYMLLITFMYFSDRLLPIRFEDLEEFVIKSKDTRLFVGFFNYACKHNYETQRLEEWTERIKNNGSSIAFYAVSLFLQSIHVDLSNPPPCILNFITRSLNFLGIVHFSKKSVAKAFFKHSGVKWFFIRSIVSLDVSYFDNYPLIQVEFADASKREKIYIDYFDSLEDQSDLQVLVNIFISLSSIYFHTKITYNKFFFPICHKNLLSFVVIPSYPIQVSFSDEFFNSLLNLIDRQTQRLPMRFFNFFVQCKMQANYWKRLRQIITSKIPRLLVPPFLFNLLPCLHFNSNPVYQLTIEDVDKFRHRPPSFSRAFCRSLVIPIAPIMSQKFILDLISYLTPVFPALSYPILPVTKSASLYDKILLRIIEPTPDMFTVVSRETFFMFKAAMKFANPLKKNELAMQFLKTLVSEESHITFVALACHELKKLSNIGNLISMREIVNGKNFLMYCIMLRRLERMREENWDDMVLSKLESEEKKKIFSELGTNHIMKRLISWEA
ncbi:hypothetical protein M9Y10_032849 [Tritrichomonas musculus]|uniref:Uncharacterized protein n=1 Tax=Tritrichomonas musculus TaxID=1915356 RepID=A0ABR2GY02_9EUKA